MKQTMILAAGLGTRLKPLTDTMPKALVPVGGTPLLDINIRRLQSQGYDRFVVNIHHFAQQIVDHVAQQDYASLVHFSDETEQLLETGGGLKKAQSLFRDTEPILIHNVDILDKKSFCEEHNIDIFIDDSVRTVTNVKDTGIDTFIAMNDFNLDFTDDNITNVYSMNDFYNKVHELEKKI